MSGLVINGREHLIPGLSIRNFLDDPELALRVGRPDGDNDGKKRTKPVSLVVLHTTKGIPGGSDKREQVIEPGFGPNTNAEDRTARFWAEDPRSSGAHLVVDHDGSVGCLADLQLVAAYHAGQHEVNERSIGIEMYQGSRAELYVEQISVVVALCNFLTAHFGIQRQIPSSYAGRPVKRLEEDGGRNVVGVIGHRDVSDNRGKGDPGDFVFEMLTKNGYERFDLRSGGDLGVWKKRQELLRAKTGRQLAIDGIPGPATVAALREAGYRDGLWTLPPKEPTGAGLIESLLDGFLPVFLSATSGDKMKALDAVAAWLARTRVHG